MSASSDGLYVDGRRIVHRVGQRSQTVSVCTDANQVGTYQSRYRLPSSVELSLDDLVDCPDLAALEERLLELNGQPEGAGKPVSRLPDPIPLPDKDDEWAPRATADVERAIAALVNEFVEMPYLHRVEHSLHIRLAELITHELRSEQRTAMASGEVTQLVHKEWPETVARQIADVDRPRGLFDLAVLAPSQIKHASLDQFRAGRINPPIAIEVGLNYGLGHLSQDIDKLHNSRVPAAYIVHFSRVRVPKRDAIEQLLTMETTVRCAYVHHDPDSGIVRFKHLDGTTITDQASSR